MSVYKTNRIKPISVNDSKAVKSITLKKTILKKWVIIFYLFKPVEGLIH